jgi:ParB-like chromosome segregation protein Spo0J
VEDVRNIPTEELRRCPIQLRPVRKDTLDFIRLRDSLRDLGFITSCLVRPQETLDGFEVCCGAHRFEAAKDLRRPTIPCIVKKLTDAEVNLYQVEENATFIATDPRDYYRRFQRMLHDGILLEDIAAKCHQHPNWVERILSLNYLSPKCKESLDSKIIPTIMGIELAKLPVHNQDRLLSLQSEIPEHEFLELIRQEVREHRLGNRARRTRQRQSEIRPRAIGALRHEYLKKEEKATILTRAGLCSKEAADAWDACYDWIMQQDAQSRERAARKAERLAALKPYTDSNSKTHGEIQ